MLLYAVFHADHESDICFPKKIRFFYRKIGFKPFKNRILNFLAKKFFPKKPRDTSFDAEFNSLQDGIFSFHFGTFESS